MRAAMGTRVCSAAGNCEKFVYFVLEAWPSTVGDPPSLLMPRDCLGVKTGGRG